MWNSKICSVIFILMEKNPEVMYGNMGLHVHAFVNFREVYKWSNDEVDRSNLDIVENILSMSFYCIYKSISKTLDYGCHTSYDFIIIPTKNAQFTTTQSRPYMTYYEQKWTQKYESRRQYHVFGHYFIWYFYLVFEVPNTISFYNNKIINKFQHCHEYI
ncbi:hypothetical protein BDA99DRAFT_535697 [Phascolomyces articulosus]|uniref:Uncharacterized protein n=1 Tax=Phascolomyces articulosus TaxID=60185 RepID=A0AAD5KD68_9FUNG|nr:hypothetical protein BDA99DRAFT_535697 [Phascolomyces articulosus]